VSADFDKFLKLEKRLFKLIDDPLSEGPTTSRKIMGKKERIRNKMRKLEPKIKGMKDGGSVRPIIKVDKDGKIRQTGKKRLKDGTIAVQPEGGIKFIPNKKDGGLMEAIEKVKKEDATKMQRGGMAGGKTPKTMRAMNKLDDAVEEFIETIEPFQGTVRKGETLRNIGGKTMIVRRTPNPNFGNMISDRDRAMVGAMLGEGGRMISDADRRMVSQMMGARRMEDGGVVPAKFKGFSKLPEDVQQKMNPRLAKKFKAGGPVKMGSGGGVCRGMGAARAGGKFKLR
jgi:hypothetical protein